MSQHQPNTVDPTPEIELQHPDGLTLDKQLVKDLQPSNDDQVQGGYTAGGGGIGGPCLFSLAQTAIK